MSSARWTATSLPTAAFIFAVVLSSPLTAAERDHESADPGIAEAKRLLEQGNLVQAQEMLRRLIAQAVGEENVLREAVSRKWLALCLARMGRRHLDEAREELSTASTQLQPLARNGNEEARKQLGFVSFDTAALAISAAAVALREQRMSGAPPNAYYRILKESVVPAQRALDEAAKHYPQSLRADLDVVRGDLHLLLARLAATFLSTDDALPSYGKACADFRTAIQIERARAKEARHDVLASAHIGAATVLRERATIMPETAGRSAVLDEAVRELSAALALETAHRELHVTAAVCQAFCRMERFEGRPLSPREADGVEKDLLHAADTVERMRKHVAAARSFQTSASFFSQRTAVYEALALLHSRCGRPEKMLAAIEQMKARALRDMLNDGPAAKRPEAQPFDLTALQQRLAREKAGLVEYFYGPQHAWFVWVPPKGEIRVQALGLTGQQLTQEIRSVLRGFSDPMLLRRHLFRLRRQGNPLPEMQQAFLSAQRLHDILLKPLDPWVQESGVGMLYVVPHHVMHYLPFQGLVVQVNEQDLASSRYYAESGLPIAYLPAAAVLTQIPMKPIRGQSTVFLRSDFQSLPPRYDVGLPSAPQEAERMAQRLSGTLLAEASATESRLRCATAKHAVLYFATHGVLASDRPLSSAILLSASDGDSSDKDGRLTVAELTSDLRNALQTDLVVLSACLTNRGEANPYSGDDITALSRAFLIAGARSVLATQWEASDDAFPKIMDLFFDQWLAPSTQSPKSKARALQAALREYLSQPEFPMFRYPLFWASIILLGDGSGTNPL